jgi:DNA invertase Pin-like site-specific DNA recombinase
MAQTGKVNCIIVKDLSRWGRNYLEVGDYLEQKFPAWGTRFISISDLYDSAKLNGTTSGIDIAFRNLICEMYSRDLSEHVRSSRRTAAKQGKYTGSYGFFGYKKDPEDRRKLIIDPDAEPTVRRIFALALQGMKRSEIARQLNTEGWPTAQQLKAKQGVKRSWTQGEASFWYDSAVSRILHDERYTGKLIFGKTIYPEVGINKSVAVPQEDWIVADGVIPAIITPEQFQAVRGQMTSRQAPERKQGNSQLLFSKKLKCADCGLALRAVKRKNGVKYDCRTAKFTGEYGCKDGWIMEDDLKNAVLAALQQQVKFADDTRRLLEARKAELTPGVEKFRAEIARLQRSNDKSKSAKMGLWEKYQLGGISAEAFQREREKADKQAVKLAGKIRELEGKLLEREAESGRENVFVERFSKQAGITELTRAVVEEFICGIKVYSPERIEITFNYADEYEKILALTGKSETKRRKSR